MERGEPALLAAPVTANKVRRDSKQPYPHGPTSRVEGVHRTNCSLERVSEQIFREVATYATRKKAVQVGGLLVVDAAPLNPIVVTIRFHHSTILRRHEQIHIVYLPKPGRAVARNRLKGRQSITPEPNRAIS